jgi:hypothetical protein
VARARVSRTGKLRCFSDLSSFRNRAKHAGCGRVRSRNTCFGHVLVIARRDQRRDAAAAGKEQLARCTAGQSKHIRLYQCSGKLALGAMYLRRVQVVGRALFYRAPPLTHVCTAGACGTKPRRGPLAALRGQALRGMLGAIARIAPARPATPRSTTKFEAGK